MNKAELTSALAMRTKMSKADATRTVEALFDDKGIIATELKKGSKVQITGLATLKHASVLRVWVAIRRPAALFKSRRQSRRHFARASS